MTEVSMDTWLIEAGKLKEGEQIGFFSKEFAPTMADMQKALDLQYPDVPLRAYKHGHHYSVSYFEPNYRAVFDARQKRHNR